MLLKQAQVARLARVHLRVDGQLDISFVK